jgi:thioredoxin-dependent peroxiredoxin
MSKKTRKKSSKTSPAKVSRTGPQKPTRKPAKTGRPASAPKSAKTRVKTLDKTPGKLPRKAAAKISTKASAKAPPRASKNAAAKKPATVAVKKSVTEMVEGSKAFASTTPTATAPAKSPATMRTAAPSAPSRKTAAIEGEQAPEFDLPRDGGERVSLADHVGRKLVIFFYPRADTPGCTREAIDFTRLKADFAEAGTAVLGVSADPIKAQESFRNKHQLSIPLISDETHEMLQAYGAWGEKSMYGRIFQGVIRTTVLIGADGRIARIWHGVKVDGHADAVLAAAREF